MPNVAVVDLPKSIPDSGVPRVNFEGTAQRSSLVAGLADVAEKVVVPEAEQWAAKAKEQADKDAVRKAHTELTKWQQKSIYAPYDFNPGAALNQKGEDAKNLTPRYLEYFDGIVESERMKLGNQDQIDKFDAIVMQEREQLFGHLSAHERKQYDEISNQSYKESLDEQVKKAWMAYDKDRGINMVQFNETLNTAHAIIEDRARGQGWSSGPSGRRLLNAEKAAFTSRAYVALLTSMKDFAPGEAWRMFNDVKDQLDFTQPGVKDLETGMRAIGVKAQAMDYIKELSAKKLSPEQQVLEIINQEKAEKPVRSSEVLEYAKAVVTQNAKGLEAVQELENKNTFEAGRNEIARNPWAWTPATSPHYQNLYGRKSAYASHLQDYQRTLQRSASSDANERRVQKSIDAQYLSNLKDRINIEDPEALNSTEHDKPEFQNSLTRDRLGNPRGLPTDEAVAKGKAMASGIVRKAESADRVGWSNARNQVFALLAAMDRGFTQEETKRIAGRIMTMYGAEVEALKRPMSMEEFAKFKAQMTLQVKQDPDAWLFTDEAMAADAAYEGKLKGSKPVSPRDQPNPVNRPGYTPPTPPNKQARPGYTIVRKGGVQIQVPSNTVDEWLTRNPTWSK